MSSFVYRIATHSDKEGVESIDKDIYAGFDYLPGIYDKIIDFKNCIAMVAEDTTTHEIVGYVHGLVVSVDNRAISIQAFRIKPHYRGGGLGSQLRRNLLFQAKKVWPSLTEAHVCHYNKLFESPHYQPHPLAQLMIKKSLFTISFPIDRLDSVRLEAESSNATTYTTKICEDFMEFKQFMIDRQLSHVLSDFQLYETCKEFYDFITMNPLSSVLVILDGEQQTVGIALVELKLATGICARICSDVYVNNMNELNEVNVAIFQTLIKMIPLSLFDESPHPNLFMMFSHDPVSDTKRFAAHLSNHFSVDVTPNVCEDYVLIRGYRQPIETFMENL